jgi:hypothetical protein
LERAGGDFNVNAQRISHEYLAAAVNKVQAMTLAEKSALIDEIHQHQPNLLASCLVQPKLGVTLEKLEFLLHILMVCFQAMKESARHWPVISEDLQEQQLQRLVGSILFSEDIADPLIASQARAQYLSDHPESPLFTYVVNQCQCWLLELADNHQEAESDKFVMLAAVNIANCIAQV